MRMKALDLQVLRDPKQKRFFKSKDIHDLFTLGPQYAGASETASIFSSLHGGLEVPLDPDSLAVPAESSQAAQAGGHCLRTILLVLPEDALELACMRKGWLLRSQWV